MRKHPTGSGTESARVRMRILRMDALEPRVLLSTLGLTADAAPAWDDVTHNYDVTDGNGNENGARTREIGAEQAGIPMSVTPYARSYGAADVSAPWDADSLQRIIDETFGLAMAESQNSSEAKADSHAADAFTDPTNPTDPSDTADLSDLSDPRMLVTMDRHYQEGDDGFFPLVLPEGDSGPFAALILEGAATVVTDADIDGDEFTATDTASDREFFPLGENTLIPTDQRDTPGFDPSSASTPTQTPSPTLR